MIRTVDRNKDGKISYSEFRVSKGILLLLMMLMMLMMIIMMMMITMMMIMMIKSEAQNFQNPWLFNSLMIIYNGSL